MPVFDEKYLKAKVREFDGKIRTNFLGNEVPKENMQYTFFTKRFYNHKKTNKHSSSIVIEVIRTVFFNQEIPQAQKVQKKHKNVNK